MQAQKKFLLIETVVNQEIVNFTWLFCSYTKSVFLNDPNCAYFVNKLPTNLENLFVTDIYYHWTCLT